MEKLLNAKRKQMVEHLTECVVNWLHVKHDGV